MYQGASIGQCRGAAGKGRRIKEQRGQRVGLVGRRVSNVAQHDGERLGDGIQRELSGEGDMVAIVGRRTAARKRLRESGSRRSRAADN